MSLDTEVWILRPERFRETLLSVSSDWDVTGDSFELERDDWLLIVTAPESADVREAEASIAACLKGGEYRVSLGLEPVGAPRAAVDILALLVRYLLVRCGGTGIDVDTGETLTEP